MIGTVIWVGFLIPQILEEKLFNKNECISAPERAKIGEILSEAVGNMDMIGTVIWVGCNGTIGIALKKFTQYIRNEITYSFGKRKWM